MIAPTADIAEFLARLRAPDDVEALRHDWPAIGKLLRRLKDILGKQKGKALRQPRMTRDPRDGSEILEPPQLRAVVSEEWQQLWQDLGEVLERPAFRDVEAMDLRATIEDFRDRILATKESA
jgi:hypothetical protein